MKKLIDFTNKLERNHIYYELKKFNNESIMVQADIPGERWEIEFYENGEIVVSVFKLDGDLKGEESLDRLFEENED